MRIRICPTENNLDNTLIIKSDSVLGILEEERAKVAYQLSLLNQLYNIQNISGNEVKFIKKAISSLEMFYTMTKKSVTEKLEKEISDVVNLWYANDYDFKIEMQTSRGKVYTSLIDRKRGGRLSIVCGGAVKQTLGVLFNFAFIRSVGSEFIFLDESFSSLGIEEVNRLPEVFELLNDIQLVCIEHKCELIDSNSAATIRISREVGESSKFEIIDPNLVLKNSILELDNVSVTEQDKEILKLFGFDPEQVSSKHGYKYEHEQEREYEHRFDDDILRKYYEAGD